MKQAEQWPGESEVLQALEVSGRALKFCESPIEQMMLAGLCVTAVQTFGAPLEVRHGTNLLGRVEVPGFPAPCALVVSLQFRVDRYRIDFALQSVVDRHRGFMVAVECDGHDYHDRTKEQAQRDKARDRFLHASGFLTARFTGSEIYRAGGVCAYEAWKIALSELANPWRAEVGRA